MRSCKSDLHRRGCEAGQALIMVTIGIAFLLGLLGLTVDIGYGYYLKQVAQAAADSAATAAAQMANDNGGTCGGMVACQTGYSCPASPQNPPTTNFDSACLYAKKNGLGSVTLSASSGSPPGAGVAANYWITATASQTMPLGFLSAVGFRQASVAASATAALIGTAQGGCIWVLDPTGSAAFNAVGTSSVTSNCSIHVNSTASDAMTAKGTSTTTASAIYVAGGVKQTGGAVINPTPITGAPVAPDPLANLPAPDYSGCNFYNLHLTGGTNNLTPGVYCGGIQASGQAVLNFASGNYILNGGGLQISSANVSLNGNGVFFYNTANGYSFGPVVIVGGATVNLTAPTSGTYRGILLFQDRNVNTSSDTAFGGGSTENLSGTIYLPTGTIKFAGGSATQSLTMALVVKDLNIVGNAFLKKDTTGALTGISSSTTMLVQ